MATMRQIRNRIRVAGNIAQITGAMEMVAAAKLKKAQDLLMAARPYVQALQEMAGELIASIEEPRQPHPLAAPRPPSPVGLVVITADRGLCGSYNSGVIKQTLETLTEYEGQPLRLMAIGRRGRTFFRRRGYELDPLPVEESGQLRYADAEATAAALSSAFLAGGYNRVMVIYTRFISPISQRPVIEQLLPIPSSASPGRHLSRAYLTEPASDELMDSLLPRYVVARLYYTMLESAASEHAARMTSMSAATDNATQMISSLTLALNRARQAAITKEISEIVSGAEALAGQS